MMTYNKSKSISYLLGTIFGVVMLVVMFQYIEVFTQALSGNPISSPISAPISSPIASPTPAPDQNQGGGNNNSGGNSNSGGSNTPAPCNSQKPHFAPRLVSWVKSGPNQVTLNWTKSTEAVDYYAVSYGLKPHLPIYGDPHVGNKASTSTVINGLSGQTTYYFTVSSANGCVHSDPSNEIAVKINGAKLGQVSTIYATNTNVVSKTVTGKAKPAAVQPEQSITSNTNTAPAALPESKAPSNILESLHNFFKLIFN